MDIRKYLKEHTTLITDGAMGTYYASLTGKEGTLSEFANIEDKDTIRSIHKAYIDAGAMLIRTNTFSANSLLVGRDNVKPLIRAGCKIARQAANGSVFVAASIGPVPEIDNGLAIEEAVIINEYKHMIDVFFEEDIDIFVFETFGSLDYFSEITQYIKDKNSNAFIVAQFALTLSGATRKGIGIASLTEGLRTLKNIDAYGFNCGIGPYHLYHILKDIDFGGAMISALPNAGYPMIVNERTVFSANPGYFAEWLAKVKGLGVKLIGGCCGTTPEHIRAIAETVRGPVAKTEPVIKKQPDAPQSQKLQNAFAEKLAAGTFTVAVELDSPMGADVGNFMKGAHALKQTGADIITIADSPLARPRIDAFTLAAKIKRETGMDAMPHLCCRDRNIIALRSAILGGYVSDIRNLLLITGDAIASPDRTEIKSVFNLNSYQLMRLVNEMNKEKFASDPYCYGGAINVNTGNPAAEMKRIQNKLNAGARFFLTQPVFEASAIAFIEKIRSAFDGIKILTGIMPIVSYNNAKFLDNEIPGIHIPADVISRFSPEMTREEAGTAGTEIAVETAQKVRPVSDGYYLITPFNRYGIIVDILKQLQ